MRKCSIASILTFLFLTILASTNAQKNLYLEELKQWDGARIAALKDPNGWLNLEGLFWLKKGFNSFGSASTNDLVYDNPAFPKHTVVEQDPMPGAKVKKNRKIYIKINSSGFNMVRIPNLIQKTYRQAVPTLKSLGLEPGEITYKPDFAEVVLEMYCNGKKLNPGDKIFKSSKIDLVIGDGSGVFEEEIDSLSTETPPNEQ